MTVKEVQKWSDLPAQGIRVWNPIFRQMNLEDALKYSEIEKEWKPYGYDYAILCRDTSEFHLFKSIQG